jgi:hypothetical protein
MSEPLKQYAVNVVASEKVAGSVGAGSLLTVVVNTFFDVLDPVVGSATMIMGFLLSYVLYKNRKKKGLLMDQELINMRKELELKQAQIDSLKEENH